MARPVLISSFPTPSHRLDLIEKDVLHLATRPVPRERSRPLDRGGAHPPPLILTRKQFDGPVGKRARITIINEVPGLPILDRVLEPRPAAGHHGHPARVRFDDGEPPTLFRARVHEKVGLVEQFDQLGCFHRSKKADGVTHSLFLHEIDKVLFFGPTPHDQKPRAGQPFLHNAERVDDDIDRFVFPDAAKVDDRRFVEPLDTVEDPICIMIQTAQHNIDLIVGDAARDQIVLGTGAYHGETAFLVDKMVLAGATGLSSEFFPLEVQAKLEKLVDSISALADNANEIIGDTDNKTNVKKTLSNITVMTAQATETLKSIKEFSNTATVKIESAAENLNDTLVEFRGILAKINNGDSTAAKLLNDGRLYENLLDSSQELQMALEQFKKLAVDAREKGIKIKL